MRFHPLSLLMAGAGLCAIAIGSQVHAAGEPPHLFATSDQCLACHNGLSSVEGRDVSMGHQWRSTLMANSARDPYWQAAVRREVLDHPQAQGAIEDECATCHMPMARYQRSVSGQQGRIFANLPAGRVATAEAALAADSVSCSICHQVRADGLGDPATFTGGFVVDETTPFGERSVLGPYEIDEGNTRIMQSASRFRPERAAHVQSAAFCASCHTLYTHSLGPDGQVTGELPEQVPYLEWEHSDFAGERPCQSCHMPGLAEPTAISSVLGDPREGFSQHVFRGGNFFVASLLNRHGTDLGVQALPQELEATQMRTVEHLQSRSAELQVSATLEEGSRLECVVDVRNLAGHKLPTAYPSRRAWLHVTVRGAEGQVVFESGQPGDDGAIAGNDNDADPTAYEPHYTRIEQPHQVQIYEAILVDPDGQVTTGLLTASDFGKDNRILPRGFDNATAHDDIAVKGAAADDGDFLGGGDRVVYSVPLGESAGPFQVEAELRYQPIGYRWAHNLADRGAEETDRFVGYYREAAHASDVVLVRSQVSVEAAAPAESAPLEPGEDQDAEG